MLTGNWLTKRLGWLHCLAILVLGSSFIGFLGLGTGLVLRGPVCNPLPGPLRGYFPFSPLLRFENPRGNLSYLPRGWQQSFGDPPILGFPGPRPFCGDRSTALRTE